ncbi:cupin domain-containing protein [Maricaulis sp.]|uniref:cupin domain-containing protein n=1 Tax=Maricaulis sp. TaxID=1486257 RepID=UPI002B265471|nr:cupin domain-containing protein [Maricaulis sp.]
MTRPELTLPEEARRIIETLGLQQHPEGGWYVETLRDPDPAGGRDRSTAIYYLLAAGEQSHWHRVDAVEIWHWHAGSPLELSISAGCEGITTLMLGPGLMEGQRPQGIVPEGAWQSARSNGAWTLVGCTVAPGFRFDGFELAPPGWSPDRS